MKEPRYDEVFFDGVAWLNQLAYTDYWPEQPTMKRKKRKAYIAGPMRSKPFLNYPAFDDAAKKLRAAGWIVYNPAEMDRREDGIDWSQQGYTIEEQEELAMKYARRFAHRDLDIIINEMRAEDGDAIVLLPDWEESTGANAEVATGRWVGLRILTLEKALEERTENGDKTRRPTDNRR